ncbi:hypothetical protein KQX54_002396 [Cotesia glomerata]|uniref:Uncharacterized protein n=1 Tax=Cotesia glomerata TaxID=32391 RepID=A0AAV7I3Y6_COTGL|nr:hypothetical protein KQX54_002396 [Cotesia glomerata]
MEIPRLETLPCRRGPYMLAHTPGIHMDVQTHRRRFSLNFWSMSAIRFTSYVSALLGPWTNNSPHVLEEPQCLALAQIIIISTKVGEAKRHPPAKAKVRPGQAKWCLCACSRKILISGGLEPKTKTMLYMNRELSFLCFVLLFKEPSNHH